MEIPKTKYTIKRHDFINDKSLKPWSSADEYLLHSFEGLEHKPEKIAIYNDRFGYLSCHLHSHSPALITTQKSQEKTIEKNFQANKIEPGIFFNPLSALDNKIDFALLKTPKSLGLFQLFLEHIVNNSCNEVIVVCAFMTRHFSSGLLQVAGEYFEEAEQSQAVKKARLLTLKGKKKLIKRELISTLTYEMNEYKQYLGVFSADHIDYATQFFLEHFQLKNTDACVLDLASGNGIIGNEIFKKRPDAEIHLMDDSYLAVSSAELNVCGKNIHHHYNNDLSIFDDNFFDLIVSNPPFHFEHEISIDVTLELFKGCYRCLKAEGNLQMVANKHLNYKTHLSQLFASVEIIAENQKFIVYKCEK